MLGLSDMSAGCDGKDTWKNLNEDLVVFHHCHDSNLVVWILIQNDKEEGQRQ